MTARPSEPTHLKEGLAGAWVELRDSGGNLLYQCLLHEVIPSVVEEPGDPGAGELHVHATEQAEGTLPLIVPDIESTATVHLWGTPPGHPMRAAAELAAWDISRGGKYRS